MKPDPPSGHDVAHGLHGLLKWLRSTPFLGDGLERGEHLTMTVLLVLEPAPILLDQCDHGDLVSRKRGLTDQAEDISPPDNPTINHVQTRDDADDDPPGLASRRCVLLRDIGPAIGAPLRFLVDLAVAMRAGECRILVVIVRVDRIFVQLEIVIPVDLP